MSLDPYIVDKIIYNEFYYLSILINFLFMYKVLIKPIIKEKILYFRELVGILSWVYFAFTPILGEALAVIMFVYGFVSGLNLFENKVILRLR